MLPLGIALALIASHCRMRQHSQSRNHQKRSCPPISCPEALTCSEKGKVAILLWKRRFAASRQPLRVGKISKVCHGILEPGSECDVVPPSCMGSCPCPPLEALEYMHTLCRLHLRPLLCAFVSHSTLCRSNVPFHTIWTRIRLNTHSQREGMNINIHRLIISRSM